MTNHIAILVVCAIFCFAAGILASLLFTRSKEASMRKQRLAGHSIHFTLGFNYLTTGEIEKAIEALKRISSTEVEATEAKLILGNLLREKGRVEAALSLHEEILKKTSLTENEKTLALFCLALDFKKGGFIDRSIDLFHQVLERDPDNIYALRYLEKLYEEEQNWEKACEIQKRIEQVSPEGDSLVLGFLENQMGETAVSLSDIEAAKTDFEKAITIDRRVIPAYINLGTIYYQQKKFKKAKTVWEEMLAVDPQKLHLVSSKLEQIYQFLGEYERLREICAERIEKDPDDWRARMTLGEIEENSRNFGEAFSHYRDAIRVNQHYFPLHHRMWNLLSKIEQPQAKIKEYLDLCEDVVTLGDPYICIKCHYHTTDFLWRCPSCHEWNTFVEETR